MGFLPSISKRYTLFFILLVQVFFGGLPENTFANEKPLILFISSYHPAFPSFEKQMKGFTSVFSSGEIILDVEFMDSKRFPKKENIKRFKGLLSYKMNNTRPYDLIVTADDNALLFVLEEAELFKNIPVVFFGVNDIKKALQQDFNPMVTGVVESVSMEETISLMLNLKKDTQKIVAISDSTTSGESDAKTFLSAAKRFPGKDFEILSMKDFSWDELAFSLRIKKKDTAILLLSAYVDKNQSIKNFYESLDIITKNSVVPVYHLWLHGIGSGLMGGKVISHFAQGKKAGEIARTVLSGEDISKFSVVSKSPNRYIFDCAQLEKYEISKRNLPDGSEIVNCPHSHFEEYKKIFLMIFIIIFMLSFFLIVAVINILKRKVTEKKLKESEERYSSLFNNNNSAMLIIKPATLEILDVNPAAVEFYGWSYEDLVNKKISDINTLETKDIITEISTIEPGRINHYYFQHRVASGEIKDVEVHSSVISQRSEKIIFSIIHDITEEKRLKQEIEKMDRIKSIGTLAGGIAHDFNNILMIIFGNISIAMEYLDENHRAYPFIEESEKALERAKRLTKQLLTFSKGGEPVKESLKLDLIAEDVASFDLSGSNVKAIFNKDKDLWSVDADKGQIQQVFSNLIINADQAMQSGGYLYFNFENSIVRPGEIQGLESGRYVVAEIRDTGKGMDSEILEMVFDPYFTTKSTGSGLGLTTTYSIITRHKGKIEVESRLGKGTSFRIFLPASDLLSENSCIEKKDKEICRLNKPKILVMDDEEMILTLVGEMLLELGCIHEVSRCGEEAVEKYGKEFHNGSPFDLVIMDLTIPGGVGGREAVKRILEIDENAKVIVSSGYTDDEIIANYGDYGFQAVMIKPYNMDSLNKIIFNCID